MFRTRRQSKAPKELPKLAEEDSKTVSDQVEVPSEMNGGRAEQEGGAEEVSALLGLLRSLEQLLKKSTLSLLEKKPEEDLFQDLKPGLREEIRKRRASQEEANQPKSPAP